MPFHCIDWKKNSNVMDWRSAGSKSYIWVYRSGGISSTHHIVLYEYQKTRNASHPIRFLKDYEAIYREEGKLKHLKTEERLKQRQLVIKPLVDALFAYAKQHQVPVGTQGKLARAVTYLLNQEKYLRVFLENGEVPMDNNASERAIRGFCIGRKNWQLI